MASNCSHGLFAWSCRGRKAKPTRKVPSKDRPSTTVGKEWQQRSAKKTGLSLDHQCRLCSSKVLPPQPKSTGAPDRMCLTRSSDQRSKSRGGMSTSRSTSSNSRAGVTSTPAARARLHNLSTTRSSPDTPRPSTIRPASEVWYFLGMQTCFGVKCSYPLRSKASWVSFLSAESTRYMWKSMSSSNWYFSRKRCNMGAPSPENFDVRPSPVSSTFTRSRTGRSTSYLMSRMPQNSAVVRDPPGGGP
mmetsp:Transcript_44367/g.125276  ORF Transcript_44367/g.125276 Transcript_44367/m.125276 type:complete len:245 (-) Transcript_44367:23-757(-)